MPRFLVLRIYLLIFFLSSNDERIGWNRFLCDGSVEDDGDNYSVSILTSMTWRLLFTDGDIDQDGDGVAIME